MFSFSWITLLNKLLNLAVLGALCGYLVTKYLSPYIKRRLKEQDAFKVALEQEAIALRAKKKAVICQTEEKKAYATELLRKIKIWKNAMEEREKAHDRERKEFEKKSREYLEKRADGLCQTYLRQAIVPRIFTETEEQLRLFFKDKKAQERYIARCIKRLEGDVRG